MIMKTILLLANIQKPKDIRQKQQVQVPMNDATYVRVSMSSCSGQVFVVTLNEKLILD